MNRTDLFPGLIVVLLIVQVYKTGDGHMPTFTVFLVMTILYLLPVYLVGAVILENVANG